MSRTLNYTISLGGSQVGLTLQGQLYTHAGVAIGSRITTGFAELGGGCYALQTIAADDFSGVCAVFDGAAANPLAIGTEDNAPVFPAPGSISAATLAADVPQVMVDAIDSGSEVLGQIAEDVADKTGYKLASDGLDSISTVAPTGLATTFREMLVQTWWRFVGKIVRTSTSITTYAADGTTGVISQNISESGNTQTLGEAKSVE